jgi:hypothetical protein
MRTDFKTFVGCARNRFDARESLRPSTLHRRRDILSHCPRCGLCVGRTRVGFRGAQNGLEMRDGRSASSTIFLMEPPG